MKGSEKYKLDHFGSVHRIADEISMDTDSAVDELNKLERSLTAKTAELDRAVILIREAFNHVGVYDWVKILPKLEQFLAEIGGKE